MTSSPHMCPLCGTALSSDIADGMCPRCLMRMAKESALMAAAPSGVSSGTAALEASNYAGELPLAAELQTLLGGNYLVESFLGQGGMGAVYKGFQMPLRRPVAIKILQRRNGSDDFEFEERFRREAYAMAALAHPHIVQVYDCGMAGKHFLFISMELLQGGDVNQALKSGGITQEAALNLIVQVCDGLQAAHDRGIVHRDIKPANIFLTEDGCAKVADFGLAKKLDLNDTFATRTGMGMGTPDYAAPEQFEATGDIDHRADIYAVGVMLYQMLTGTVPRGAWLAPSRMVDADSRLDEVVARAMNPHPDGRYSSAALLRDDIVRIMTQPVASPAPPADKVAVATSRTMAPTRLLQQTTRSAPVRSASGGRFVLLAAVTVMMVAGGAYFATDPFGKQRPKQPVHPDEPKSQPAVPTITPPAVTQVPAPLVTVQEPTPPLPVVNVIWDLPADGSWLDVVPLVQLPRDLDLPNPREDTDWHLEDGQKALVATRSGSLAIISPRISLSSSYDLSLRIKSSLKGGMVCVHLPVGQRHITVMLAIRMSQDLTGFEVIDNEGVTTGARTIRPAVLQNDVEHLVTMAVRSQRGEASIELKVDEKPVLSWAGKETSLHLWNTWARMKTGRLGLAASTTGVIYRDVKLRRMVVPPSVPAAAPVANTTPTVPSPASAAPAFGAVVNLLSRINPARDTVRGIWKVTADGLVQEQPAGFTAIEFNYVPPEEYDFEVEFTMRDGRRQIDLILAAAGQSFVWKHGSWFGFDPLDGKLMGIAGPREEATSSHQELPSGKRSRCIVEVRKGSLRVFLDREQLLHWQGDFKRLGNTEFVLRNPRHLGLGSWNTTAVFHKIEVREMASASSPPLSQTQPQPIPSSAELVVLSNRNNLANALQKQGRYVEAEKEHRAVFTIRQRLLGPENKDTLQSRSNLGYSLWLLGRYAEAEVEGRATLAIRQRTLGPEDPDTLVSRSSVAMAIGSQGRAAESEAEHRAVLALRERILGPENSRTLMSRNSVAAMLYAQGKKVDAEREYRVVFKARERVLGPEDSDTLSTIYRLASVLKDLNQLSEARLLARRAMEGTKKTLAPNHPDTKRALKLCEELGVVR